MSLALYAARRSHNVHRCAIIGLSGLLTVAEARAMPRWDRGCYGDTVEITLVSPLTGEPKVPLSIPIGGYLLDVIGYAPPDQETPYYPTKGCVKEPILARSVYILTEHRPFKVLGFSPDKPTVRRFEIDYSTGLRADHYGQRAERIRKYQSEGKAAPVSDGFLKLYPTPSDAGRYVAPFDYHEPSGEPLVLDCFPNPAGSSAECHSFYWIPGDLLVTYWFMTDHVPNAHWLELDQLMREVVKNFVVDAYWTNWKDKTGGIR